LRDSKPIGLLFRACFLHLFLMLWWTYQPSMCALDSIRIDCIERAELLIVWNGRMSAPSERHKGERQQIPH
jgi:hypothetical protein